MSRGKESPGSGPLAGLRKAGNAIQKALFTTNNANTKTDTRHVIDEETGKITVKMQEMDFIAANDAKLLSIDRHFDINPGSENECELKKAITKVVQVLRSNPVQRKLVRAKMFYDDSIERKPDPRVLAGNIKTYIDMVMGSNKLEDLLFAEMTIEILSIYLLGACTDTTENDPRIPDSELIKENDLPGFGKSKNQKRITKRDNDLQRQELIEVQAEPESVGTSKELAYVMNCGIVQLLDFVLENKTLGLTPFLLGSCSQTLVWTMGLYRVMIESDDMPLKHAYEKKMVRTCWEVIALKTRMRDPNNGKITRLKVNALFILLELGNYSADQADRDLSINIINLNTRSVKELTKLLHHQPAIHPTLLAVITLIGQKETNNALLKQHGMLEYFTTKVLPFYSASHRHCIPNLVILLNSWIVNADDLQFFYQFNGIQCLVFHMKCCMDPNAAKGSSTQEALNWEDMLLHGISILYKLSDSKQYHMRMYQDDCLTVLLEALRVLDPLKSIYHLNAFIACVYILRNVTADSIYMRMAILNSDHFLILSHLLSTTSLPVNCLIHLLFLFSTLSRDRDQSGEVDAEYCSLIMNKLFLSVFRPLCKIIQAAPLQKVMDDSQLTVLCLALQTVATLVSTAKQENPLLCIQIEYDLPLENLKSMAKADSKTPYPELANKVLGMVYLMP